ncbi:MAG: ATP-binding protein [Desulfococcaceae bacterium]
MNTHKWNLRSRFIFPTVTLIILGMTIPNAVHYFRFEETFLNSISEQLIHQAEAIVRPMDEAIENIRLNFVYWSSDATLTTVVQELLGEMVREPALRLLKKIPADYGYYEKVMAANCEGIVVSSSDENEIGRNISAQKFFSTALGGEFYLSDVYASSLTGLPVFVASGPLFMENEIVGTVCGVVSVSYFNENFIKTVKIGEKGYAFVCRKDGLVIADPDRSKIMKFNINKDLPRPAMKEKGNGLVHYSFQGKKYITALRMSRKIGWIVGVTVQEEGLLRPIRRLTFLNITVMFAVFVLVLLALFGLVRIITRQLQEIVDLRIAKEGAELASKSKSCFLANMSHEIRTPMNAVLGFTDLLRSEITDPKHRQYLESVMISGKNLLTLINDILDLSKIEAGKMELNPEPLALSALFGEIRRMFEPECSRKQIAFLTDMASDIPAGLMLDQIRLRQILVNLVGNAVKFTDKGHIRLSVQKKDIAEDMHRVHLRITVADTGIGIPRESLNDIFEAFTQVSGQNSRSYGGTGLGLTITRNLVEMMNGAITVKSTVNRGTEFCILLRNVSIASVSVLADETDMADADSIVFREAAVLVVDDNEMNRRLMQEMLTAVNLKVFAAENGAEGVASAQQNRPNLILMDIKMPVMDGFEAMEKIRSNPELKHIPIIALTASAMKAEKERIQKSRFDAYVVKPVERTVLFRAMGSFLQYSGKKAGNTPADMQENYPPQVLKKLPEIVRQLEALMGKWQEVRRKQYIPDIKEFGREIQKTGDSHGIGKLSAYGSNLLLHIDSYDIEKIFALLEEYPDTVASLKNSSETE